MNDLKMVMAYNKCKKGNNKKENKYRKEGKWQRE